MEVVAALAIAALALTGLYRGLGGSQSAAARLELQLGARIIARAILADEQQAAQSTPGDRAGDSGPYRWQLTVARADAQNLPPAYHLYRLTADVSWPPHGRFVLDTLKLGR